jgi:hypothetical protein
MAMHLSGSEIASIEEDTREHDFGKGEGEWNMYRRERLTGSVIHRGLTYTRKRKKKNGIDSLPTSVLDKFKSHERSLEVTEIDLHLNFILFT